MKECKKCILTDAYYDITFNEEEVCSLCSTNHVFHPYEEEQLFRLLETV